MAIVIIIWFTSFLVMFALGSPIAFAMMGSSILYLLLAGIDLSVVMDEMLISFENQFLILAVPLFIFAARIMNSGKITQKIFDAADSLVGWMKGGLAHANVIASVIFAGMTGSEIADVAGLGTIEVEAMKEAGYDVPFSCAVTAASATIGPIIPPSIPMVIYALLSGTSVGFLFLGGFIPGIILAFLYMVYIYYIAGRRNYPTSGKISVRKVGRAFRTGFLPLMTPVILLGGIYTGVFTPTEAAAAAGFYAIIIALLVFRTVNLKSLTNIVMDVATTTGTIVLIAASAFLFGFIVSHVRAGDAIVQGLTNLGIISHPWILLLMFNILFLVLGCFINTSILQWILIPLLLPIVRAAGIDLVHFGVVAVFNMMLGLDTPPYGMTIFILSATTGESFTKIAREMLPFIALEILALLIITFIPDTVLFLPRIFGYVG
jgi:tripartite ATP-independent transporter DctM subunit